MRILIVEPGKRSRAADIPHMLKAMQGVVGGLIAAIYPWTTPSRWSATPRGCSRAMS